MGRSSERQVDTMSSLSAEIDEYQRAIYDLDAGAGRRDNGGWPSSDHDRHRHDLFPSPGDARERRRR